ncbi:helix-turn-helix domain-containing protein [Nocardia sp. NPDC088792]|uniref:helix-turn-helix domain-containing protein n=1 Tax=Nocardia sp. NPDC088792 TaxID=3364332 RepID=UPI00380C8F5D
MATSARTIGELTRLIVAEIRAATTRASWTQPQLAERSGVPFRTLEKILRLESAIDVEQLRAIAQAFGITPDELIAAARRNGELYSVEGSLIVPDAGEIDELLAHLSKEEDDG